MKKAFKKAISILLVAVMIFGAAPLAGFVGLELPELDLFSSKAEAATQYTEKYYEYSVSDGKATITDVDESISGDITIPSTLDGYPVTSIGDDAFNFCSSLTSITIPDSVTNIGDGAFFDCSNLTSVTIPDSVTTIGKDAFFFCGELEFIHIPASVTSIGEGVSEGSPAYICSDTENCYTKEYADANGIGFVLCEGHGSTVEIINGECGDNIKWTFDKSTGELAISGTGEMYDFGSSNVPWYSYRSLIKTATISNGITNIGNSAFYGCGSLTSVTIPDGVTSIGVSAFEYCRSLASAVIPDSVTCISNSAFYNCNSLTSVTIPDGVTSIGNSVFYNCNSLTSATIPDSVTYIGDYAFYNCNSLTSATIPDGVTNIGNSAFYSCSSLTSITIPGSVTSIGNSAFSCCSSLTSVTIPNDVTSIGHSAFSNCSSLTSITVPDSVTSIGDSAFSSCSSLTSVTIPDSVTSIGYYVFFFCDKLEFIHIPASVTSICEDVLTGSAAYICSDTENCYAKEYADANSIEFVLCEGHGSAVEIIDEKCGDNLKWTFDESTGELAISGTGDMYDFDSSNVPWRDYRSQIKTATISDGATSIGAYAFYDCRILTSAEIPDSVTSIGDYAFEYCRSLASVGIPDSVTTIGLGTFFYCENLTNIEIPKSTTSIGKYAFAYCYGLTSIKIPDSVTSIGEGAFVYCTGLTSAEIPDGVTTINNFTFAYCHFLANVKIPDTVTSIGYYAFGECYFLTNIEFPDGVTTIGEKAFIYCYNLANVEIPDSITTIGNYAFGACYSLTSIDIPDSVTTIGDYAFNGCCGLESVHIPSTVTSIGKAAIISDSEKAEMIDEFKTLLENASEEESAGYAELGMTKEIVTNWKPTTLICSDSEDSAAKTFAEENGNEFKLCKGLAEHTHTPKTVTIPATCTVNGVEYSVCEDCGELLGATTIIPASGHTAGEWNTTSEATCTADGTKIKKCTVCSETIETGTIPSTGHTAGEWEIILEPTTKAEGKKIKKCTVCSDVVDEAAIPALKTITDNDSGVSLTYSEDKYSGEVDIVVEESFDGSAFNIIDTKTPAVQTFIYDITMTVDGVVTQPNGKITVTIPLPQGYSPERTFVYYVNTSTGTVKKMPAVYKDGYMTFETDHFSYYALVEEFSGTFEIRNPSTATIKYGDSIVLHADMNEALPSSWKVEWTASNENFTYSVSDDGTACTITSISSGDTVFTATVYDANGNEVSKDEQTMTSKAGFFDKIIAFFKKIFGLTKVIPEAYNGIY